jgi:hypothetical protein
MKKLLLLSITLILASGCANIGPLYGGVVGSVAGMKAGAGVTISDGPVEDVIDGGTMKPLIEGGFNLLGQPCRGAILYDKLAQPETGLRLVAGGTLWKGEAAEEDAG